MTVNATNRRVTAAAAIAAGAVLALAGCSAGQISQTAVQVPAVNGNLADVGSISLRNVHVLYPDSQEFTNSKGGKAALAFVLINNSAEQGDHIDKISTEFGNVDISPADRADLPAQRTLVAGTEKTGTPAFASDPESEPIRVEVTDLKQDITPGLTVPVTFDFQKAGAVTVNVPVDAGPDVARQSSAQSGAEAEGHAEGGH